MELKADPETVWRALTDPQLTKQYFFGCETASDWQVGSPLDYRCEVEGAMVTVVTGEIRAIDPPRYLETTCRGVQQGVEGPQTVATYTLTPSAQGTTLAITQGEFEDQDQGDPHGASWDRVLAGLKALVEG